MKREAEAPLLPAHLAIFDAEAGAGSLGDGERSRQKAERGVEERPEFRRLAGHRNIPPGIEQIEDRARGEIDVGHDAFDGVREIVARIPRRVIGDSANHAALFGAVKGEVPGGPGDNGHVVEIVDTARLDGGAPARVGAHDLVGASGILAGDDRLRAGDLLQPVDAARREIGNRLPRGIGIRIVEHREGAPRRRHGAQDHLLGRLIERDQDEARRGCYARLQECRGFADLRCA